MHKNPPRLLTTAGFAPVVEGDCACASSTHAPLPAITNTHLLHIPDDVKRLPLDGNFHVYLSPRARQGASVLNGEAVSILGRFESPLAASPTDTPEEQALIREFISQGLLETFPCPAAQPAPSEMLTAWLHITDRCNLRCAYCYLPHLREDMSMETAQAAIAAIIRSAKAHSHTRVKLKYAGGEPLLRFPFLLQLHEYAKKEMQNNGLVLDAIVLSNGIVLTEKIAQALSESNIRLMVSLDGLGNYHDTQRQFVDGSGSFSKVSAGINTALKNGLTPHISITVSARTIDGLPHLLEWILRRDIPFNINFYRENTLSAVQGDMQFNSERMINGLREALKVIEADLPRRNVLASIIDRSNLYSAHTHTCDVGESYMVFDQNGRIAKCQMLIHLPVANIHTQDPLRAIRNDKTGLQNLRFEDKTDCKTCDWRYWCAGGCPLATHRATGRYDVKSPNCDIYKAIFPEILRLEGFRILKYDSTAKTN
jgi:uncharacterized protein